MLVDSNDRTCTIDVVAVFKLFAGAHPGVQLSVVRRKLNVVADVGRRKLSVVTDGAPEKGRRYLTLPIQNAHQ